MTTNKSSVDANNGSFAVDKQVEILLKEFESLRSEANIREGSRAQITSIAVILIGALTTLSPLILSSTSNNLLALRIPLIYLIVMLFIVSFVFSSLQLGYLLQDFEVGNIAIRVKSIRISLCKLLQLKEKEAPILKWDLEHIHMLNPTSPLGIAGNFALSLSRYVLMTFPALASLIAGIILCFLNVSQFNTLEVVTICIFFFADFLYFLSIVPCGIYSYQTYLRLKE